MNATGEADFLLKLFLIQISSSYLNLRLNAILCYFQHVFGSYSSRLINAHFTLNGVCEYLDGMLSQKQHLSSFKD